MTGCYPELWQAVLSKSWSHFDNWLNWGRYPAHNFSWNDVQQFMVKLRQTNASDFIEPLLRRQGYSYSLPTEAQWEYACRAGSQTIWPWGNDEDKLGDYAWYDKNSGEEAPAVRYDPNSHDKTHAVGEKKANAWGLHDMLGNVWEWVADWDGPYQSGPVTDPTGPDRGNFRMFRGGSYLDSGRGCRPASRCGGGEASRCGNIGFRLAFRPGV